MESRLREECEAVVADVAAQVGARQAAYRAAHGRYWQGLEAGVERLPSGEWRLDDARRPAYQAEDWAAFGVALPEPSPCTLRVDVYDGPQGSGWVVRAAFEAEGRLWVRALHGGPGAETWRTHDWRTG